MVDHLSNSCLMCEFYRLDGICVVHQREMDAFSKPCSDFVFIDEDYPEVSE